MAGDVNLRTFDVLSITGQDLLRRYNLRLTKSLVDQLDRGLGGVPRSTYVRMVLNAELRPGQPTGELIRREPRRHSRGQLELDCGARVQVQLGLDYETVERVDRERGNLDRGVYIEALLWRGLEREHPHLWPGWTPEAAAQERYARIVRHAERVGLIRLQTAGRPSVGLR